MLSLKPHQQKIRDSLMEEKEKFNIVDEPKEDNYNLTKKIWIKALQITAKEAYADGHIQGRKDAWKDCEEMYEELISQLEKEKEELKELIDVNCKTACPFIPKQKLKR